MLKGGEFTNCYCTEWLSSVLFPSKSYTFGQTTAEINSCALHSALKNINLNLCIHLDSQNKKGSLGYFEGEKKNILYEGRRRKILVSSEGTVWGISLTVYLFLKKALTYLFEEVESEIYSSHLWNTSLFSPSNKDWFWMTFWKLDDCQMENTEMGGWLLCQ